ncbi:MAG: NAD(+) diphosphatase [Pseudomonadota bacterium]
MPFAGSPIDRSSNERRDAAWLKATLADPDGRYLAARDLRLLVDRDAGGLAWSTGREIAAVAPDSAPILLGTVASVPHFVVDVTNGERDLMQVIERDAREFMELRRAAADLEELDIGTGAYARSLLDYHLRHPFCARCGQATQLRNGGASRYCPRCETAHFPRTDPVAIALVIRNDHCLLGRSGRFSGKLYSALAGFIEPGESIEDAVRREIKEESGVDVGAVRYFNSQPWPFPASLMIGCHADALSEAITIDAEELADARWFSRADIIEVIEGRSDAFSLPGRLAIANYLIRAWAYGEA